VEVGAYGFSPAPLDSAGNLSRLVTQSLREFVARRKALALDAAMAEMGADPAIRRECATIAAEFAPADPDRLAHD
jgi:hypothetical protein